MLYTLLSFFLILFSGSFLIDKKSVSCWLLIFPASDERADVFTDFGDSVVKFTESGYI